MLLGRENQLLAALPAAVYRRWEEALCVRELEAGHVLEFKGRRGQVYFPISCVVAIYATNPSGRRTFMRFVGSSFAAGLVNMMSTDEVVFDGVVCGAGYALTIPSQVVLGSFDVPWLSGGAQSIAMARTAKGGLMIAQCLGVHDGTQRLARLLMQAHDGFGETRAITLTQQALAEMLSTRRETAAGILAEWNRTGVIDSRRGAIHIRRRDELERASCECYSWIRQSYVDELELWKSIRWRDVTMRDGN